MIANACVGSRKGEQGVRMHRNERRARAANIDRNHARRDGGRGRTVLEENTTMCPAENVVETQ